MRSNINNEEIIRLKAKFNNEFLNERTHADVSVQTMVDSKNVPFTVAAEKILEAKLASKLKPIVSIIKKVEEDRVEDTPMSKTNVADFMHSAYVKQAEEFTMKETSNTPFEDILYAVMEQRFIFKKKVK